MIGVYLLHFQSKIEHAGHYMGSAVEIEKRLAEHYAGNGARLMGVVKERGIGFVLTRVWECETEAEARELERRLKRQKNGPRLCPICNGKGGERHAGRRTGRPWFDD